MIYSKENWLGSEVGRVLKSAMITATSAITKETVTTAEGTRTIARSGSVFVDSTLGIYGLIYNDTDITDGDKIGSVMVAGHYIAEKLPAVVSSENLTKFAAQGLFPVVETDAVRPDWATQS